MTSCAQVLRADHVLPIDSPGISDGAAAIGRGRILAVGPAGEVAGRFPAAPVRDLGEAILLPGLVDAHTHLTWADEPPAAGPFASFIDAMAGRVRALDPMRLARVARRAAHRLLAAGVTCVGDSGPCPEVLPAIAATGLAGVFFLEVFGPGPGDAAGAAARAERLLDGLSARGELSVGLAPHAPYTVGPDLFRLVARIARERDLPLSTHLGESREESEFLARGEGPLATRLRARGIAVRGTGLDPASYLASLGVLDGLRWVLAHGVHLPPEGLARLGDAAIVLCPASNERLAVGTAPVASIYASGLEVAIGTDGAVTDPAQDPFEAMRRVLAAGAPSPAAVVRSATLGGATALGLSRRVGSIAPGKRADLVALAVGPALSDPYETVVRLGSPDRVVLTICGGRIVHQPRLEGTCRA